MSRQLQPGGIPQSSPIDSPWPLRRRLRMLAWDIVWAVLCSWTPKPLNRWRLLWLLIFGARIQGRPFVHQRARIAMPWNLTLRDRACLGDRCNAYCLGPIEIEASATVAQEVYLCSGTHDFSNPALPLAVGPIRVGAGAFVGLRAIVLPGVSIGDFAVVGAGSVVTADVPAGMIGAGNPCRVIRERKRETTEGADEDG